MMDGFVKLLDRNEASEVKLAKLRRSVCSGFGICCFNVLIVCCYYYSSISEFYLREMMFWGKFLMRINSVHHRNYCLALLLVEVVWGKSCGGLGKGG